MRLLINMNFWIQNITRKKLKNILSKANKIVNEFPILDLQLRGRQPYFYNPQGISRNASGEEGTCRCISRVWSEKGESLCLHFLVSELKRSHKVIIEDTLHSQIFQIKMQVSTLFAKHRLSKIWKLLRALFINSWYFKM